LEVVVKNIVEKNVTVGINKLRWATQCKWSMKSNWVSLEEA
jgi:predicted Rdx family selenoprotein